MSNKSLIYVGGSSDTKETLEPLITALLNDNIFDQIIVVAFGQEDGDFVIDDLLSQPKQLENTIEALLEKETILLETTTILGTSMGAFSLVCVLANNRYVAFERVIFLDPADYYLDGLRSSEDDASYTWSGSAQYQPEKETAASLLPNISLAAKIDVVFLSLRNYMTDGYVEAAYKDRGADHVDGYSRLNADMVRAFYDKLPEKNKGRWVTNNVLPHRFMRDGDVEKNVQEVATLLSELTK